MFENQERKTKTERLFLQYRQFMFNTAYKILKDPYLADDAVQQAFERIIKNLHKIDESNVYKTRSFLSTICQNTAYDIYNSKLYLNNDEEFINEIEDNLNRHNFDPLKLVQDKEIFNCLVQYINELEPIYRDCLVLKFYHDMHDKDIAKVLNINETTARKRLQRGREKLLKRLKKEGLYRETK